MTDRSSIQISSLFSWMPFSSFSAQRSSSSSSFITSYSLLPSHSQQSNVSSDYSVSEKDNDDDILYSSTSSSGSERVVEDDQKGYTVQMSTKVASLPLAEERKEERPPSRTMVIFSVLFYLVAALVMVMANKWVLNSVQVPLFFLFAQLTIAVVLLHMSAMFGYFSIPTVDYSTCQGLFPLVGINVTGLIFNTYCLQYVDASFYQVARGLVLPFTVLFSFFLLSSRTSTGALGGVAVVCIGFFLGVSSENLHASPMGTVLGIFSSLTTSVHAITVKRALGVVKGSTMDLVYYNNLLSAALLAPLVILSGESTAVVDLYSTGGNTLVTFITGTTVTGFFGFLICIAGFLSIKVTSPVSHMISSAVRGVIQTFLGMWVFGDIITTGRGAGIFFILLGSTWYTYIKDREQRAREAMAPTSCCSTTPSNTSSLPSSSSPYSSSKSPMQGLCTSHAHASTATSQMSFSPRTPTQNSNSSDGHGQRSILSHTQNTLTPLTPDGLHKPSRRLSYLSPSGSPPQVQINGVSYPSDHTYAHTQTPQDHSIDSSQSSSSTLRSHTAPTAARSFFDNTNPTYHGKSWSVTDFRDMLVAPRVSGVGGGGGRAPLAEKEDKMY